MVSRIQESEITSGPSDGLGEKQIMDKKTQKIPFSILMNVGTKN